MLTAKNVLSTLFNSLPSGWTPPKPNPKWTPPLPKPKETFSLFSHDIFHYHDAF